MDIIPTNYNFYDAARAEYFASSILQERWDAGEHNTEDARAKSTAGLTLTEEHGSRSLREIVVKILENPDGFNAFSPKALRTHRHLNQDLFLTFLCKRVAHVFSLMGELELPGKKKLNLESFNETFTMPMLTSSLLSFALELINKSEQRKALLLVDILRKALFHDRNDDAKLEAALKDFQNGLPIVMGGGFDWHSTQCILFQDYFIYCNRGWDSKCGSEGDGWNVFKIGNKEKINAEWIKKITNRLAYEETDYPSCKKLIEELDAQFIYRHPMKGQRVGNCTYTSFKALISALMVLVEISDDFKNKVSADAFKSSSTGGKKFYTSFSNADRRLVLSDLLKELKATNPNPVILALTGLIYNKIIGKPLLGFKIGWDLWIEFVDLYESFSKKTCLSNLRVYLKEIPKDEDNHARLLKLIEYFSIKEVNQQYLQDCNLLMQTFANKKEDVKDPQASDSKENISLELVDYFMENKWWAIADKEIRLIQNSKLQMKRFQELFDHLISEQLWDHANKILPEIQRLDRTKLKYFDALKVYALKLIEARRWESAKIAIELLQKLNKKPSEINRVIVDIARTLADFGMCNEALSALDLIQGVCKLRTKVFDEISMKMQPNGNLDRSVKRLKGNDMDVYEITSKFGF